MCNTFTYSVLVTLCTICCGYKVLLVFPFPNNSYAILGEKYVQLLIEAGHDVTYVTPFPTKYSPNSLRQIEIYSNVYLVPDKLWNITNILNEDVNWDDAKRILRIAFKIANNTAFHANVQNLLLNIEEQYDVVVVDWFYSEILYGFSVIFNCPLIWATSMEPNPFILRLLNVNTESYYVPGRPSFSFGQWMENQYDFLHIKYNRGLISDKESSVFNKAFGPALKRRGRILPSFEEVKYNGSLVLGNSHASIDRTPGVPMNYVPVSGYYIEGSAYMIQEIQTIMDNAKEGVIYFTLGSDFKSDSLPAEIRTAILDVFSTINKTILWKYNEGFQTPNNVHTYTWLSQQSVLAHPNCVLMITSGGLLSINEAIHFGVPIIGMPFLKTQANNIERAVNKGFAKKVELNNNISSNLKAAIIDALNNSTYTEKVQELSLIYRDRPIPPNKELVFWIEHVIRTKGAGYLRSSPTIVPWYQNLCPLIVFTAIISIFILILLLKIFLQRRSRGDEEVKKLL